MRILKLYTIFALMLLSCTSLVAKDINKEVEYLQSHVTELEKSVGELKRVSKETDEENGLLRKEVGRLNDVMKSRLKACQSSNDSLRMRLSVLSNTIKELGDSVGVKISNTNSMVSENKEQTETDMQKLTIYGLVGLLAAIIIALAIYFALKKKIGKGSDDLALVKEANQKLAEQSVALDNRLAELLEHQLLTDQSIKTLTNEMSDNEDDHSLVLSIANEVMRIEQNLMFMDPKTKGVSQLRNRSKAITSALAAKGYEIPNLVGTEYKDGMNYETVMEEDEEIPAGEMRIKRVARPCVMYKGKMIQSPKVVVAFNPE